MAKRQKATIEQVFPAKSANPIIEAKALYDVFKANYGANPILDQAVRLVAHAKENGWNDAQVKERTHEAVRLTDTVDSACARVARCDGATPESKEKERLVRSICTYLYDCLE